MHFKFYENDGDDATSINDNLTDDILGAASSAINKKQVKLKYDHSDPDWGVTPMQKVDYSKAKLDVDKLMEPHTNVDLEDVSAELQRQEGEKTKL